MATGNKSGFLSKVFHLDVKHHVAWDLLIPNRCNMAIRKDIEGNANLLHSFAIALDQKVLPFLQSKSKSKASLMVLGTSMPNSWVHLR